MRSLFVAVLALLGLFVGACSVTASIGDTDGGTSPSDDAATGADTSSVNDAGTGTTDAAAGGDGTTAGVCGPGTTAGEGGACLTPPMLQIVNKGGGFMATMELWTVVFTGDETTGTQVDAFHAALFASTYYTQSIGQYGITGGTAKGVIVLPNPPASVDDTFYNTTIPSLVGKETMGGTPFVANTNTVVAFLIPKATTEPVGSPYHDETTATVSTAGGDIHIPFIVLRQDPFPSLSDFDNLTWSESHEVIETATDPHADEAWLNSLLDFQGEVGDLCNDIPAKVAMGATTYNVTRVYSAAIAAARSGDPCYPAIGTSYENVALSPLEVKIENGIGKTGQVQLLAFSDGTTASMHWELFPDDSYTAAPASGDITPGQNVTVTLTRTKASPNYPTVLNVWITGASTPDQPIPNQEWFGAVSIP